MQKIEQVSAFSAENTSELELGMHMRMMSAKSRFLTTFAAFSGTSRSMRSCVSNAGASIVRKLIMFSISRRVFFPLASCLLTSFFVGSAFGQRDVVHREMIETLEAYAIYKIGDFDNAFVAWMVLAEKGNTQGMLNVANMYQAGEGVEQNLQQAVSWYRKGAERGDSLAMYSLAAAYEKGLGVVVDSVRAMQIYELAAGAGSRAAQRKLADFHLKENRIELAQGWLQRAADGGDWEAQTRLALLAAREQTSDEPSLGLRQKVARFLKGLDDAANARDAEMLVDRFDPNCQISVRLPGHLEYLHFELSEYQQLWARTFAKAERYRFNRDRFDVRFVDDHIQVESRIYEYLTTADATQVLELHERLRLRDENNEFDVVSVNISVDLVPQKYTETSMPPYIR